MVVKLFKWFALSILWWGTAFTTVPGQHEPASTQFASKASYHPFYVSVTEISQNLKERTLEISCKIFAEDFETTLTKDYKTPVDFTGAKSKAVLDKIIPDYVNRHLNIVVDGKPVTLTYVGFEKEKESAFCYFQAEGVGACKKLDVMNSLLQDFNDGQINIVHVVVNG